MGRILAIDPGNIESGWVLIDAETRKPITKSKSHNSDIVLAIADDGPEHWHFDRVAIEMVASYGMAVGAEVFETCVWIGRFQEALVGMGNTVDLIKRTPVKVHHCHNAGAKDSNIVQALVDRFAPGQPNKGKGTKSAPGWFHGFAGDIWQAYALAVYAADQLDGTQP